MSTLRASSKLHGQVGVRTTLLAIGGYIMQKVERVSSTIDVR